MALRNLARLLVATALLSPAVARAQTEIIAPPNPDADALAAEVRVLAANPNDLNALLSAGELALKLGDPTAAAAFFARANNIDPHNGRQKAGLGSVLLAMERPGEALRRFGEAESYGYPAEHYAGDRGLAFDLVGDQARAQRDYRLALKQTPEAPELRRRYALSLAISGERDRALEQIDPLLRQSDRAAWRVRAFVLAMTGDVAGAEKIATTMLPNGMADNLRPFFQRLPRLSPLDRAWAVHFGEVVASPARLADAKLAPSLPPLPPEARPKPVVQVAAAAPVAKPDRRDRKAKAARDKPVQLAAATPPPVPVKSKPEPLPPSLTEPARPEPVATRPQPIPARVETPPPVAVAKPTVVAPPPPKPAPVVVASTSKDAAVAIAAAPKPAPSPPVVQPAPVPVVAAAAPKPAPTPPTPTPPDVQPVPTPAPAPVVAAAAPTPVPGPTPEPQASTVAAPASATPGFSTDPSTAAPKPKPELPPVKPEPVLTPAAPPASPVPAAATPVGREDSILARIIANIGVPARELDVPPPRPRARPPEPIAPQAPAKPDVESTPAPAVIEKTEKPAEPVLSKVATKAEKPVDPKVEARRKAEEKKKAEDKKKADAEKAEAKKQAALAKASPSRVWVQVAGGASEGDLPKAWAAVRAKAPAAFKGKQGWSTPLRFTNRVLAGPFKSSAEAQSFVNELTKAGISSFVFTSAAGQKIDKLGGQ